MSSSPAYDVAQFLVTQGYTFGGNANWCVGIAAEPDNVKNSITVFDQSGGAPDTDQLDLLSVRVQVRVKAEDYLQGYDKAVAIRDLMMLVAPRTMNEELYIMWNLESDIWNLGRNDLNQYLIVANYLGLKKRT
jgi:hypothetical protein